MNPWQGCAVPALRNEAVYGDRVVACFAQRPRSLLALFERSRAQYPEQDATVFEGQRWSYAQVGAQADELAARFAALGNQAGVRVVMFISNRPQFITVLLALQQLGAIAVPVGIREQRPGLAFIIQQCGAVAAVFDEALAERIPDAAQAPSLVWRLAVESLDSLAAVGGAARAQPPSPINQPRQANETDVAVILYTSGTTGQPKGAMLTHLAIVHSVMHFEACMQLGPQERSALAVPASHVTGLIAIIATMWQVGGAVVIIPEFKADAFVRCMAQERVSHTLMVPAMYKLCLLSAEWPEANLSAWRVGGYGGAPMPVATIDALAKDLPTLTLQNAYGATETTSPTTLMPPGQTRSRADTVGVALPAAKILVMDEIGQEVAPGETGELWIGGPMVVPGYWANPEATAREFTAGFWHSGDLGSVDLDGYVRILDRKKDMLNRGGFKIYCVEVENVLMAWPGVVEAAVIGLPCPVLGERVHAVLYGPHSVDDSGRDEAAIKRHCARQLADYKVPETVTWSEQPLPRNANGKVMKRLLRG